MTVTTLEAGTSVRLTGHPDPNPSRWLWLVKMFLAVPHYIVLVFLWIAFLVVTVVAGCQVLVAGRYPRALFDFNLGVLRWNWRVGFYVYTALGTDRYPPFTLARVAEYPAALDLPSPEQLRRGLTLIRSWLAAGRTCSSLPDRRHAAPVPVDRRRRLDPWIRAGRRLLDLQRAGGRRRVVSADHRPLPQTLFDLLMGINRWLYRVLTFSTFMATAYPPFRLDQGTSEPDTRNRPQMNTRAAAASGASGAATRTQARI